MGPGGGVTGGCGGGATGGVPLGLILMSAQLLQVTKHRHSGQAGCRLALTAVTSQ